MELNSTLDRLQKYEPIDRELNRAYKKHPGYPVDMFRQLAIMQEEAGEVTKAVLHYHYEDGTVEHIREELIQTAAMCMRMLENLPAD
jgi:NTP pyrophosphatase (non-canonical NTP hydrolase)